MNRNHYSILFPNGDKQELDHSLKIGDIVDINGNVYTSFHLNPKKIAYKVAGMKSRTPFKDVYFLYKLELLTALEVNDEIFYRKAVGEEKNKPVSLGDVLDKLEKKLKKGKWR